MQRLRALRREDGASLVEFAFVAPVLFLVVFGIIDFGWIFAQHQDVRHGAREGARLAVVDWGNATEIKNETKARTGSLGDANETVLIGAVDTNGDGTLDIGESVVVRLCFPSDSLTGFFDFLDIDLVSTTEMRMEQQGDDLLIGGPDPVDADGATAAAVKADPGMDCP